MPPDEHNDSREEPEPLSGNCFIDQPSMAVDLVSKLIHKTETGAAKKLQVKQMKDLVHEIFRLFSDEDGIPFPADYYRRFMLFCDKLIEQNKIRTIRDKTIVSFGGHFSSGKSSFINAITDMATPLPVNQTPTTSIPTYIAMESGRRPTTPGSKGGESSGEGIHGAGEDRYTVHCFEGYSAEGLPRDAIVALSHDFSIPLSSFVESIVITTDRWKLPPGIALLDTPGYNKPETGNDTHDALSYKTDKSRAREQLKKTDYLIWLVDIGNGTLKEDDYAFINNLKLKDTNPVLIVFNKADKKDEDERAIIVKETVDNLDYFADFRCFGVTAYSSKKKCEYDLGDRNHNGNLIADYFDMVAKDDKRNHDLRQSIKDLEYEMLNWLNKEEKKAKKELDMQEKKILTAEDPGRFLANPLTNLWAIERRRYEFLKKTRKEFEKKAEQLNLMIRDILPDE